MGQFSWFTQDSHRRIVNGGNMKVVMTDNKGNKWHEDYYGGYGEFGGKDYYALLAEMNGITLNDCGGDTNKHRCEGIRLAFADGHVHGDNPNVLHPSLSESGEYFDGVAPESDPNQGFPVWLHYRFRYNGDMFGGRLRETELDRNYDDEGYAYHFIELDGGAYLEVNFLKNEDGTFSGKGYVNVFNSEDDTVPSETFDINVYVDFI